ncbi:MAG: MFS transporter [Butyrivibrio sp.]|uniref:MFS transporter n=1 Tax=Butyrivibrio sp. TaxID=28121 RepID=UPI0025F6F3FC|nr:MFS transporter [Butyrivibrio sp.]MCR5770386.1 MFS transporter [Butyrivibrio sp.]
MDVAVKGSRYSKYWSSDGLHHASPLRMWGFTLNNVATNMYFFLMAYSSYYLVGFVGMAVILASSFATIMRVWDGFTDPVIGYWIDKTNGKFGKSRPFMIVGNIGLHVMSFILFHVTHQLPEGMIRTVFFFAMSMLYYIFFTFQNAITRAGQPCLTNDPKQRPLFGMFDSINLLVMGMAITWALSNVFVPRYGTMYSAELFHDLWVMCFVTSVICTTIAVIAISPKDRTEFFGTGKVTKLKFSDYAEVLKNNKAIRWLIVAACTDKIASQSNISAITVVMWGILVGNYALSGAMTIYTSAATLIFALVGYGFIARRFGQKQALVVASIGALIFNVLMILLWTFGDPTTMNLPGYEGFTGFTVFTVLFIVFTIFRSGFQAVSGNIVLPMIADCADYEVYRSGKFVPGLMGTLFSFVDKCISSIAPMITGLLFAFIGFKDAYPDLNTPYSTSLKVLTIFVVYGMTSIGLLFNLYAMKKYPLDREKMQEIQAEIARIKERDSAENQKAC